MVGWLGVQQLPGCGFVIISLAGRRMAVKGRGGALFYRGYFLGAFGLKGLWGRGYPPPIEGDGGASESRDTSTNMSVPPALF